MRILGYGDNNVDVNAATGLNYPGGNCVNVTVFAARAGARAAYAGVFGDDEAGALLRAAIEHEGVDTALSVIRTGPTGRSVFEVEDGERRFLSTNRGGVIRTAPLRVNPSIVAQASRSDVVHSSAYSASEADLPALRAATGVLSFDFSSDDEYRADSYRAAVAPSIDVALFSCADLDDPETDHLLRDTAALGPAFVIATLGPRGARAVHGDELLHVAAPAVATSDIMDTMGCGDAFISAFLLSLVGMRWQRGISLDRTQMNAAMNAGVRCATAQLNVSGAFDGAFSVAATKELR